MDTRAWHMTIDNKQLYSPEHGGMRFFNDQDIVDMMNIHNKNAYILTDTRKRIIKVNRRGALLSLGLLGLGYLYKKLKDRVDNLESIVDEQQEVLDARLSDDNTQES